jgi:ESS family glutamate:Na+ symporter
MDFSSDNTVLWQIIIQSGILAVLLLIGNLIRRKIRLFQKTLLPTAVLAGFIGLALRQIGWMPLETGFLETVTYHMIAVGFIALGLRVPKLSRHDSKGRAAMRDGTNTGLLIVSNYLIQGVVGLIIMIILAGTFFPGLFKAAGLLLPMGFGQGPGQANNIGTSYETGYGFLGGTSFGLAIATFGFLWASIGGIIYMNFLKRRGRFKSVRSSEHKASEHISVEDPDEIPLSEAADRFTIQIALILAVYLATFLFSFGIVSLFDIVPGLAGAKKSIAPLIWGFNFLIGSSMALLLRHSFSFLRKIGIMTHQYPNNYLLNRIAGFAFDVMIIASICAIDIGDLKGLWVPFLILTTIGGVITLIYNIYMSKKIYPDYPLEGMLAMYGMMTGTVSTGILLLREADPTFKTPASMNLVTGSSVAIIIGFPILLMVGLAPQSDLLLYLTLAAAAVYALVLNIILRFRSKKQIAETITENLKNQE